MTSSVVMRGYKGAVNYQDVQVMPFEELLRLIGDLKKINDQIAKR